MSWSDTEELGPESLLGDSSLLEDAADGRERLALSTRYLANWYRATKDSKDKAIWWHKLDVQRAKIEAAWKAAIEPHNALFWGNTMQALYDQAAASWPQLWRELKLSPDTLIDTGLLDKAADFVLNPLAALPTITNNLGAALSGALGAAAWQLAPWLLLAAGVGVVYVFRRPLLAVAQAAAGKAGA